MTLFPLYGKKGYLCYCVPGKCTVPVRIVPGTITCGCGYGMIPVLVQVPYLWYCTVVYLVHTSTVRTVLIVIRQKKKR